MAKCHCGEEEIVFTDASGTPWCFYCLDEAEQGDVFE